MLDDDYISNGQPIEFKFDKKLLFDNIQHLIERKNIKIGEIEAKIGVSRGYIARTKEGSSTPSIEIIAKIAELLDTNIDRLLYDNLSGMTKEENMLHSFFYTLIKKTQNESIKWDVEDREDNNPFYVLTNPYDYEIQPRSKTYGDNTSVVSTIYYTNIDSETNMYIAVVCDGLKWEEDVIEIWMNNFNTKKKESFISSSQNKNLSPVIKDLWEIINFKLTENEVDFEFSEIIKNYINSVKE